MEDRLHRVEVKVRQAGLKLRPPLTERAVLAFEESHGVSLPEGYRRFLLEIGDGGPGPSQYGLVPLGREVKLRFRPEFTRGRQRLPFVTLPLPFTRTWVWEDGQMSDEGETEQVQHGNLLLGTDGCGLHWHLIVTGVERGHVWQFSDIGITPTDPKRDFLGWYEGWLDGVTDWWSGPVLESETSRDQVGESENAQLGANHFSSPRLRELAPSSLITG